MTTWIWIIGLTAVVWPCIILHFFEGHLIDRFETNLSERFARNQPIDLTSNTDRRRIENLEKVVELQDALIAILWEKTIGHEFSSGGYVGDEYVSTTYDSLAKSWGIAPPWKVETDQVLGEFNYLNRNDCFPWGQSAPSLRKSDE